MPTSGHDTETITLHLPREAKEKLTQRAADAGQNLTDFISQLVKHFADAPTPMEILSGDIYKRFVESGMSEDELADELNRAKHEMREDRRRRNAS